MLLVCVLLVLELVCERVLVVTVSDVVVPVIVLVVERVFVSLLVLTVWVVLEPEVVLVYVFVVTLVVVIVEGGLHTSSPESPLQTPLSQMSAPPYLR